MYRLLNKIVPGMFERTTLQAIDEHPLPAPAPEACDHNLLGEYGPDGLQCSECGHLLQSYTPKCAVCGQFCRKVGEGWRCPQVVFDDYTGSWDHA